ncbi:unnamed protein product [Symbiodinium sp. CCMP2592]|nr:unnamed protein product [Symbiodinium sp. CCMP2592]
MSESRVTPDETGYNSILTACEKGRQWEMVLWLLATMPSLRLEPDVVSYSAAISACEHGQWTMALQLVDEMVDAELVGDVICFNSVLSALESSGQWLLALQMLQEMESFAVTPNVISFSTAVSACKQKWRTALSMLFQVPCLEASPKEAYNSAIKACELARQWRLPVRLIEDMLAAGTEPDAISFNDTITAFEHAGKPGLTIPVLMQLQHKYQGRCQAIDAALPKVAD